MSIYYGEVYIGTEICDTFFSITCQGWRGIVVNERDKSSVKEKCGSPLKSRSFRLFGKTDLNYAEFLGFTLPPKYFEKVIPKIF